MGNIKLKINPIHPNNTQGVAGFVSLQHKNFIDSSYSLSQLSQSNLYLRGLTGPGGR